MKQYDSKFARQVLEDMKAVSRLPNVTLNMGVYFRDLPGGGCAVCAAGARAYRMGLTTHDGYIQRRIRDREFKGEQEVIDCVMWGEWHSAAGLGWCVPEAARQAYDSVMQRAYDPNFWSAWERFVSAYEAHDAGEAPVEGAPIGDELARNRRLRDELAESDKALDAMLTTEKVTA